MEVTEKIQWFWTDSRKSRDWSMSSTSASVLKWWSIVIDLKRRSMTIAIYPERFGRHSMMDNYGQNRAQNFKDGMRTNSCPWRPTHHLQLPPWRSNLCSACTWHRQIISTEKLSFKFWDEIWTGGKTGPKSGHISHHHDRYQSKWAWFTDVQKNIQKIIMTKLHFQSGDGTI
jgi:hypothetical protein